MWRTLNILFGLMSMLAVDEAAISYNLISRSSQFCKNYIKYGPRQGISVNHLIMVYAGFQDSNATEDEIHSKMCEPTIFPLGKIVQWGLDEGGVMKFWYLRLNVAGQFTDCNSRLVITEKHNSLTHIDDHDTPPIKHVYDCKSTLPTILKAVYRNMQFYWESSEGSTSSVTVSISKYVRFSQNASVQVRRARCLRAQDLFFCNSSSVCIPGSSHCDGNDDCFEGEGGSDEVGCIEPSNATLNRDPNPPTTSSWMTNLPWIALGILPVILVFALARICSQKRHLDIGEDYKMGFNTEDEDEGEEGATGTTGPRGNRSERSDSPDDAESARSGVHEDYADEGYSLPRHKKTMSASSDYLPANFVELTASPANRARRAENERSFTPASPAKGEGGNPAQQPSQQPQQHVVAVQINNPVYGNNVYVDVPTHAAMTKETDYTRPAKQVVANVGKERIQERMRNGQEEYTPLLPPLPPGASGGEGSSAENPATAFQSPAGLGEGSGQHCSSGTSDDYEEEPPPYDESDDFMTPPPPSTMPPKTLSGDGERPEMLHLKPLLRTGGASGGSSPKGPAPSAPNGSTAADRNNRDSDYDKNYIVV